MCQVFTFIITPEIICILDYRAKQNKKWIYIERATGFIFLYFTSHPYQVEERVTVDKWYGILMIVSEMTNRIPWPLHCTAIFAQS